MFSPDFMTYSTMNNWSSLLPVPSLTGVSLNIKPVIFKKKKLSNIKLLIYQLVYLADPCTQTFRSPQICQME